MNAAQLVKAAQRLYGKRGWQTKLSAALQVDTSTIRRWMYADHVPPLAARAIKQMLVLKLTPAYVDSKIG